MEREDFEKLTKEAIIALPKHIRRKMDNVAICVERKSSSLQLRKGGTRISNVLLGLYQGVPKTAWGRNFTARLPDKITIFQEAIENLARQSFSKKNLGEQVELKKEVRELVKMVVWHEIAHHFGFSEKQVRLLEKKWSAEKCLTSGFKHGCF